MIRFLKTVKSIYRLINNPVSRFLFKTVFLSMAFLGKWFFIIVVGPISFFVLKVSFRHALTKTFPKMMKKYFTVTFPKILKTKLSKTYPVNLISSFIQK